MNKTSLVTKAKNINKGEEKLNKIPSPRHHLSQKPKVEKKKDNEQDFTSYKSQKYRQRRKKEKNRKNIALPIHSPFPPDPPRDPVNRLTAGRVGVGCQSPLYTSPEQVGSPRKRWGKSAVWGPIHGTGLKETDGLKASFRGASIANDLVIARTLLSVLWPAKEGKLGLVGTRFFKRGRAEVILCYSQVALGGSEHTKG